MKYQTIDWQKHLAALEWLESGWFRLVQKSGGRSNAPFRIYCRYLRAKERWKEEWLRASLEEVAKRDQELTTMARITEMEESMKDLDRIAGWQLCAHHFHEEAIEWQAKANELAAGQILLKKEGIRPLLPSWCTVDYPEIPRPFSLISDKWLIPQRIPVIYFIWTRYPLERMLPERVIYVGKSIHLSNRLKNHHVCFPEGACISWIEIPEEDLAFAECFYISVLRPELNFWGPLKDARI